MFYWKLSSNNFFKKGVKKVNFPINHMYENIFHLPLYCLINLFCFGILFLGEEYCCQLEFWSHSYALSSVLIFFFFFCFFLNAFLILMILWFCFSEGSFLRHWMNIQCDIPILKLIFRIIFLIIFNSILFILSRNLL